MKLTHLLLSFFLLFGISLKAQDKFFKGIIQSSQEVPANSSLAAGVVIVKYVPATKFLELWGNYSNLSAAISASHIHGAAAAGSNAGVLFSLSNTGGTDGGLKGAFTLTAAQETMLLDGNMYVNVHNASFPGGEARAQLLPASDGQAEMFTANLQGTQQVPSNASTAFGAAIILVDKLIDSVYLTGAFTNLAAAASGAHVHSGSTGTNGPVFISLDFTAATSGTLHAATAVNSANKASILDGNAYVNVHNASFPGGEIRGQVTATSTDNYFTATLQGSQEVPANASTGSGTVIVNYNSSTKALVLTGSYQNLSSAASVSHVHGPAAPGTNAGVLFALTNTGGTSGTLSSSVLFTPTQELDLFAGNLYVNVHSVNFPGGELRGQLNGTNAGKVETYFVNLQGSQEVPANASTATASATVLLDKVSNMVFVTGSFSGLAANASAAHIHDGAVGANGPVVVALSVNSATAGTISGSGVVSPEFAVKMINGLSYLNLHNSSFPGGELRAQIGNQALPVKLSYFNAYKERSKVNLIWETSVELNLNNFEVEQQDASGNWVFKAAIAAKGGDIASKYSITDVPFSTPKGFAVYRLKMVDKDGKFVYSAVVRINIKKSGVGITVFNNPVINNQLNFLITGLQVNRRIAITIFDITGRSLIKKMVPAIASNQIDISKLPAGIYKMMVNTGDEILQASFVK